MFVNQIRAGITAAGATPLSYAPVDALRELVTAYGGTPTQYSYVGLLREAVAAKGGAPTQFSIMGLLRELLIAGGLSPTSFDPSVLWGQLASIPASSGVNIIDPAAWGNPSLGTVSADGTGNITFVASGVNVNISETPFVAVKPNTVYDWTGNWSGTALKVALLIGGTSAGGGQQVIVFANGASSGQFTTGASVGDGKLYIQRVGVGNVSGVLSNSLSIIEHSSGVSLYTPAFKFNDARNSQYLVLLAA